MAAADGQFTMGDTQKMRTKMGKCKNGEETMQFWDGGGFDTMVSLGWFNCGFVWANLYKIDPFWEQLEALHVGQSRHTATAQ